MSMKVHVRKARKLLVASVGVAAVSFVGVACDHTSVANLPAPPSCDVHPEVPYCIGVRPDAGDGGDAKDDAVDAGDAAQG
jgi:hypothetical protein